jgi:hypothetical protein
MSRRDEDVLEPEYTTTHFKGLQRRLKFPAPTGININMMPIVCEPGFPTVPEVRGIERLFTMPLIIVAIHSGVSRIYTTYGGVR